MSMLPSFCSHHGGPARMRNLRLRQYILKDLERHGPSTAWQVAKRVDALGSSVSSIMFKLLKRGALEEVGKRTVHGGRRYQLPGGGWSIPGSQHLRVNAMTLDRQMRVILSEARPDNVIMSIAKLKKLGFPTAVCIDLVMNVVSLEHP